MSDIKLFRIANGQINELAGTTDTIEKSIQILFEKNLDALLLPANSGICQSSSTWAKFAPRG